MVEGSFVIDIYLLGVFLSGMLNTTFYFSKLLYVDEDIRGKFTSTTGKTIVLTLLSWLGILITLIYLWWYAKKF